MVWGKIAFCAKKVYVAGSVDIYDFCHQNNAFGKYNSGIAKPAVAVIDCIWVEGFKL